MKGEFENRLKQVIEEVKSSPTPIIMFIDETHTLIGAGGAAGTGDAANLLKPALARGELRTIGATTWAEYKKHIEKDPALTRRFQVVKVEEPSEEKAILMLRNIAGMLEKHHKVEMLDKAIEAAVKLSHRYIPARQLPDKAVSLLDTAAARVAVSQFATPAELEDCKQRIENLTVEQNVLEKEAAIGVVNQKRMDDIVECLTFEQNKEQALTEKWQQEKEVVDAVLSARKTLRDLLTEQKGSALQVAEAAQNADGTPVTLIDNAAAITAAKAELDEQHTKLSELQGENPLILPACMNKLLPQ
jgi:type VI secretion system protein VasG